MPPTVELSWSDRAAARASVARGHGDVPDGVRVALACACILAFWDHTPLTDLSDQAMLGSRNDGSWVTQALFLGLGLAMAVAVRRLGPDKLRPLLSPPLVVSAAWLGLTVVTSVEPWLSFRRVVLFAIVALMAAGILVLMRSARQFAGTLALACLGVVAASYLSVAFLPHLAIHNAYDLIKEPEHTGLWRGIFAHKNEAGGAMALIVLTGLFVGAARSRWLGALIVVSAAGFLWNTNSKSILVLLPVIVGLSSLCRVVSGRVPRALMLVGPVAAVSAFSLGSAFVPAIQNGLRGLVDTSFTGRTEIWQFAAENILQRPLFGWGYGAFWGTERTMYVASDALSWVNNASQAHNAFLDTALIMGLPGLALTLWAFVAAPLADFQRGAPGTEIDPATLYFLRLWLLALFGGSFETVLWDANIATCCMFLLAVFGLRLRAGHRVVA